jgi:DNA (cytosine-5)-methyltransferase 1
LNQLFVEWMLGLPLGYVTGLGLSRTQELRLLGNGVVPQQGLLALSLLDQGPAVL